MGNMKFRGLSTKDLDLIIQFKPDYNFPSKDITVEHIPGRNGDLFIDNKSWQNVERTYSIVSVFRPGTDFVSNSEKLIKWLTQESGYFRLEDDYDPHIYRIAAFKGSGSLPNLYDEATVLSVTFTCKPQRYLKMGEKEIEFINSNALLDNPTGYSALPDVKIDGITSPAQDDVLLLTVGTTSDNENYDKVSSIITLSNLPQDVLSITLLSEQQTCYSNQNGNINTSINLNDTQFPTLEAGTSLISVKKYKEGSSTIESYNNKIETAQQVCQVKYMPYKSQVETKQKTTVVKSWNLLKQQVQEVYEANSYATYCMQKAKTYTFESYNNLLAQNCVSYTVRLSDTSDLPEWLVIDGTTLKVGDIGEAITLDEATRMNFVRDHAYFYINSGSIVLKENGDTLIENLSSNSSVTIVLYPAKKVSENPNVYGIGVDYDYTDNNWCKLQVNYEDNTNEVIKSISFVTNKLGYFYLPKSGLFGKAQWSKLASGVVLTTLNWQSYSKAFMPSGISVSKTATFTYYFLQYPYKEPVDPLNPTDEEKYLQYEDVIGYKYDKDGKIEEDGNGNKVTVVTNAVNFVIVPNDDITLIDIKAKVNGNYRLDNVGLDQFTHRIQNENISSNKKSTESFIVYTIKDDGNNQNPVDYSVTENWPEYLDPKPVDPERGGIPIVLNPTKIDYKVLKRGWYRISYEDNNETKNTPWKLLDENDLLITGVPISTEGGVWPSGFNYKEADENSTINYLEPREDDMFPISNYEYEFDPENHKSVPDVAFFDKDGNLYTGNQPPSWLKVEVVEGTKEDYTDATLVFKVGDNTPNNSLYKWDAKSIWTLKNKIDEGHLTDSARTDDTIVYYLNSLPVYSAQDLSNKYTAVINQNSISGDPETVSFYPLSNGYYRSKNSTNWKWLTTTEEICISKNSETTTIFKLTEQLEDQNNISITVIPRWWSL